MLAKILEQVGPPAAQRRDANDTECGLVAYVCTRDVSRVFWVGEVLDAGVVPIRALSPTQARRLVGVRYPGLGREGGWLRGCRGLPRWLVRRRERQSPARRVARSALRAVMNRQRGRMLGQR
jgi:Aldehyde dehydrogenase family